MSTSKQMPIRRGSVPDAAIDGVFGGLAGGVAMALYLTGWGIATGQPPGAVLSLFDGSLRGSVLIGALTHLAVAAVYGLVFGLVWRALPVRVPTWLAGALYGGALMAIAWGALLPLSGSPLAEIAPLHFAVGHLVYGATLGMITDRLAT
jgi:hypothetical protein